ncbi:MAG: hypothetical protein DMF84_24680 [Acidobacteria bacterium]|nr:MAG: hypothetical protein DMF84_24680 [Acidobacteriota bacterium]
MLGGRHVDEDARPGLFELKGLRMSGQLHATEYLAVCWTDRRKGAAAVADVEPLRRRIVSDVVRIVTERNRL